MKENLPKNAEGNTKEPQANSPFLSRAECNIMRGFAILIIVINNFTHLLKGVYQDNEYVYSWKNVLGFLNNLSHPDSVLPFNLISFYCPYGVILFIFLSGYGLTLKYEKGNGQGVSHKDFIVSHYNKLFIMQLKGLTIFLTFILLLNSKAILEGIPLLLQVLLVGNLNPYQQIHPGPYWFFGMIMEMYVIYRLVIYRRNEYVLLTLIVISLIAMGLVPPTSGPMSYFRINCFLAILPFCMGVLAARHLNFDSLSLHKTSNCLLWLAISFIFLTLCKFNFYSWLFLPIFVIATAVTIVKLFNKVRILDSIFGWLGALSGVLFVVHPSVRAILITKANQTGDYYSAVIYYILITIGLCIMLKPVFSSKR